jgi:hypothetical protein
VAHSRPRKAKPGTKGLGPAECRLGQPTGNAVTVAEAIEKAGGCVVGSYKDPLGGHPLLLSVLPIHAVEPTPFQRALSELSSRLPVPLFPRARWIAFTAKETISIMLRSSRFTPEQFFRKTTRSEYQSRICGAFVRCFTGMIFDGSCVVEDADSSPFCDLRSVSFPLAMNAVMA